MIFDTDIFIWVQQGNARAARLIDDEDRRFLSLQTYLELLQGAKSKQQQDYTRGFLREFGFQILPLTENIGHRAAIYIEEYALSYGMWAGDAIVAATAAEHNMMLCTGNGKHFRQIKDLSLKVFRPS